MTRWRLADRVLEFPPPLAAGIVNVTDDSFFEGARSGTPERAVERRLGAGRGRLRPARRGRGAGPQRAGGLGRRGGRAARPRGRGAGPARRRAGERRHLSARGREPGARRRRRGDQRHLRRRRPRDARPGGRAGLRLRAHAHRGPAARRSRAARPRRPGRPPEALVRRADPGGAASTASPRSRSRSTPASTSTSRSTTTSRSCGASASCATSAVRCSSPCRARTSSARCWRAPGRAGPPAAEREWATAAATALAVAEGAEMVRLHDRSALDALRTAAAISGRRGCQPRDPRRPRMASPGASLAAAAGWERAIEPGRADGRLVAESLEAARAGRDGRAPDRPGARAGGRPARERDRGALLAPARGARGGRRRKRDRHQRHGVGQVAVLQPPRPRPAGPGRRPPGALPLPDQGARPGPGAEAVRARAAAASPRDLRRRHAARGPAADPASLEPDPHQPRHAPRRHPAPPQELGRLPRQPRLGGRRRGPHLPGRVRLARRQRPAPAAPGRAPATAPAPGSSSPRPRSPTRWSSPSGWSASPSAWSTPTALRAPAGGSGSGTRRSSTRGR